MNYEATSLFKSYWRGDSKWPCFKAILYSYLYDLIGIGGELSSLTMIFWITFQIILIFVSSETGKIWEILNCFVNIFCWFFFEVKKNSWQKFTSVEPQIYVFTNVKFIHEYQYPQIFTMQSFNRCFATLHLWKAALAIVYTAFCSCYVIITDFFKVLTIKSWSRQLKHFFTMSCLMF